VGVVLPEIQYELNIGASSLNSQFIGTEVLNETNCDKIAFEFIANSMFLCVQRC
jgi:hypothetical protein